MQVSRPYRAWRGTTIALCLFAFSLLAPAIWQQVRLTPSGIARSSVQVAEPEIAEQLPAPPRMDAYIAPALPCDAVPAEAAQAAEVMPEEFASRFGQPYASEVNAGIDADAVASDMDDVSPPKEAEDYVGATHGEPADIASHRAVIPAALLSQLEAVSAEPSCQGWAARTTELLQAYLAAGSHESAAAALKDLELQRVALDKLMAGAGEKPLAATLRRVRHALVRRVDVWKAIHAVRSQQTAVAASLPSASLTGRLKDVTSALAEAERFVSASEHGPTWAKFLLLSDLRGAVASPQADPPEGAIELIRQTLARYRRHGLTGRQRLYLRQPPLLTLKNTLLRVTDDPVDAARLSATLEAYETEGRPSDAEELAGAISRLSRSTTPEERELGRRLAWHYRGTNLRFAVSDELLTRFLPKDAEPTVQPVSDTILGVPVSGQSVTHNELRARLLRSHGDAVRVLLEAQGTVASDTWARSGPVSTQNHTDGRYRVSKLVDLEADGIRPYPARMEMVSANSQLQSMQTDWDNVPLVGGLVRAMAGQRYQSTDDQRREEVERKMARRVESQFERQAQPVLSRLNENYAKRVLTPLSRLDLQPEAVVDRPADERMNVRLRVAGDHQLSGHTPRPRAFVGSLASLQVHDSLLNNVLEQLRLEGRTMTAAQLVNHLNEQLNVKLTCNAEKGGKLTFTFADQDALRVRLADDRLLLTVALAKLEGGGRLWTNFQILVRYAIVPHGASVQLVQIDDPSLEGRLSNRSQIVIQGILTNFFDSDVKHDLLASVFDAKRFGDAQIAQVTITEGWLGLSLMRK